MNTNYSGVCLIAIALIARALLVSDYCLLATYFIQKFDCYNCYQQTILYFIQEIEVLCILYFREFIESRVHPVALHRNLPRVYRS